ncbi:hypothetical protein OUZ56_016455 [Daphnia magna]|uniref:Endonuclease/exonuclease/phosphatase domain-containing protein n=1 Tax=Daphnia magna TaxID=35525 RepID=A0ABR0AQP5_9CRUS|nr:hypothetical protein OUZ56_016455 [Daphnia magna]
MKQILDSNAGGPVRPSVRQRDSTVFVRLNNLADFDRSKNILESKQNPDHLSLLPGLKNEQIFRNQAFKGEIDSVTKIFKNCCWTDRFGVVSITKAAVTIRHLVATPPLAVVNLRPAKVAAASLAEIVLENNLDIILIQEPHARNFDSPILVDIPPGYVAFHSLDQDHAYGAVTLPRCGSRPSFLWKDVPLYFNVRLTFMS